MDASSLKIRVCGVAIEPDSLREVFDCAIRLTLVPVSDASPQIALCAPGSQPYCLSVVPYRVARLVHRGERSTAIIIRVAIPDVEPDRLRKICHCLIPHAFSRIANSANVPGTWLTRIKSYRFAILRDCLIIIPRD